MSASEFIAIPPGKLAAVVTSLEMRELPGPDREGLARPDLALRREKRPNPSWYRSLFQAVGREWLWFSRLRMDDASLIAILQDPQVELYVLYKEGESNAKGLLEIDARRHPDVELAYLGLTADILAQGAGRFLVARAIERARELAAERLWVHTCSLDHPRALDLYRRAGFTPFKREVEITDDPRLDGTLPRAAAPHVPII